MSKISEVYYEEISKEECTPIEAAEFYYLFNLIDADKTFYEEYENHEMKQLKLRNRLLGNAVKNNTIPKPPKMDTALLGISSLKNQMILISEY